MAEISQTTLDLLPISCVILGNFYLLPDVLPYQIKCAEISQCSSDTEYQTWEVALADEEASTVWFHCSGGLLSQLPIQTWHLKIFFCHLDTANTFLALVNAAAFHGFLRWQAWIGAFGLRGIHRGESWQVHVRSPCVHNRDKKHVARNISAEPGCSSSCSIRMQKRLLSPCQRGAVPWLRAHTEEESLAAARGTWELTVLEKKRDQSLLFHCPSLLPYFHSVPEWRKTLFSPLWTKQWAAVHNCRNDLL